MLKNKKRAKNDDEETAVGSRGLQMWGMRG